MIFSLCSAVLRIYFALLSFKSYRDVEAGDTQSIAIFSRLETSCILFFKEIYICIRNLLTPFSLKMYSFYFRFAANAVDNSLYATFLSTGHVEINPTNMGIINRGANDGSELNSNGMAIS